MKTCRVCHKKKDTEDFEEYKGLSGRNIRRGTCRGCYVGPKAVSCNKLRGEYFETRGPESVWPKGRVFAKHEVEEGIEMGTWPPGLLLRSQSGLMYEVGLKLERKK